MLTTPEPHRETPAPVVEPGEDGHTRPVRSITEDEEKGQGVVEYFLIIVLVAILGMIVLFSLSDSTDYFYRSVSDEIDQIIWPSPSPSPTQDGSDAP